MLPSDKTTLKEKLLGGPLPAFLPLRAAKRCRGWNYQESYLQDIILKIEVQCKNEPHRTLRM